MEEEEKVLESIRDSLKGDCHPSWSKIAGLTGMPSDKTQTFHDQIEAKQKELQPWTAKINAKQATIDIAQSERDALAQKAEAIQKAETEAEENLRTRRAEHQAKVKLLNVFSGLHNINLHPDLSTGRAPTTEGEPSTGYQECREETPGQSMF